MRENAVTRFVVLFQGRSGSSFLVDALNSHSLVTAAGEKFQHNPSKPTSRQLERIRDYFTPTDQSAAVLGFKLKYEDIGDYGGFTELLRNLKVRVIYLRRLNNVKAMVSFYNAVRLHERTGKWNLVDGAEREDSMIQIDVDEFADWLEAAEERRSSFVDFVLGLGLPTLILSYEDLLTDADRTFELVFGFLGVRVEPVDSIVRKNTSDDLRQIVRNLDELRARFVGTKYESMFDEVLVDES